MVLWLAKSSISYYALPYHNLPCSSIRGALYDVYVNKGREDYTGETMTIRHPWQSDTWARGSVRSRAAMPWSLGRPGIASDTREVCRTRKLVFPKLPRRRARNR